MALLGSSSNAEKSKQLKVRLACAPAALRGQYWDMLGAVLEAPKELQHGSRGYLMASMYPS
eukprot:7516289-Pyramimonas_sp.AAC.2